MAPESALAGLFAWPVRVYYEDSDASGVAYHASYLRWFERARSEWLRVRGRSHTVLAEQYGAAFTLARVEVDYLRPARLDDLLEATVAVAERRRASLAFEQTLRRAGDAGAVLAKARVRVACVDIHRFTPRPWPAGWLDE